MVYYKNIYARRCYIIFHAALRIQTKRLTFQFNTKVTRPTHCGGPIKEHINVAISSNLNRTLPSKCRGDGDDTNQALICRPVRGPGDGRKAVGTGPHRSRKTPSGRQPPAPWAEQRINGRVTSDSRRWHKINSSDTATSHQRRSCLDTWLLVLVSVN